MPALGGERGGADLDDDRLVGLRARHLFVTTLAPPTALRRPLLELERIALDIHIVTGLRSPRLECSVHPKPVEPLGKILNSFFVVEVKPADQAPDGLAPHRESGLVCG